MEENNEELHNVKKTKSLKNEISSEIKAPNSLKDKKNSSKVEKITRSKTNIGFRKATKKNTLPKKTIKTRKTSSETKRNNSELIKQKNIIQKENQPEQEKTKPTLKEKVKNLANHEKAKNLKEKVVSLSKHEKIQNFKSQTNSIFSKEKSKNFYEIIKTKSSDFFEILISNIVKTLKFFSENINFFDKSPSEKKITASQKIGKLLKKIGEKLDSSEKK